MGRARVPTGVPDTIPAMRHGAVAFGATLIVCAITALTAAAKTATGPAVSLSASPAQIMSGSSVVLSGKVTGVGAPSRVQLYTRPYPYDKAKLASATTTASDGSYSFTEKPVRNTRYQVRVVHTSASARVQVAVVGRTKERTKAISLGRAKIVIVVYHPFGLDWRHGQVKWWFASGSNSFHAGPTTSPIRLGNHRLELVVKTALPAGPYRWRACFHAPGDHALTSAHPPPGCHAQGYTGRGRLPQGFPGPRMIARAEQYLAQRSGTNSFAVVDSEGRISGVNINQQHITGSLVKAMLLVAYLRRLGRQGQRSVDSYSNSFLQPMIEVSDNNAATQCWNIVGNAGLYEVAHAAGMTHFSVDTSASWGSEWGAALLTAHDQAKFFFEMDSLIPPQFVHYADYLLSHITSYETWGIPTAARPLGYTVWFKAGWRPSPHVYLVNQAARLQKGHERFSMAVLTDGDPDMGYGISTIEGTTSALLHH